MAEELVYHYTSVESLFKIVTSRRLRLGNIFFMNDSMEVEWLFKQAAEVMEQTEGEYVDALGGVLLMRGFDYIFCGCFTERCDDLSQWRGYADDGRGIAIGVDLSRILAANANSNLERMEVEYDTEPQRASVKEILDKWLPASEPVVLKDLMEPYHRLSRLATKCKNVAFRDEEEVRIVLSTGVRVFNEGSWRAYDDMAKEFPNGIGFWVRRGKLVPYADVDFPVAAIRGIWLGPRFGDEMAKVALQIFLKQNGLHDDVIECIERSTASYR